MRFQQKITRETSDFIKSQYRFLKDKKGFKRITSAEIIKSCLKEDISLSTIFLHVYRDFDDIANYRRNYEQRDNTRTKRREDARNRYYEPGVKEKAIEYNKGRLQNPSIGIKIERYQNDYRERRKKVQNIILGGLKMMGKVKKSEMSEWIEMTTGIKMHGETMDKIVKPLIINDVIAEENGMLVMNPNCS